MAKVTAPLFGFSATGQLGKSIVNASWRGRAYVRRYTVPANPRTTGQTTQRNLFRWLQAVFKSAPSQFDEPWTLFAKGQPLTNRNAFTQANAKAMFGDSDLSHFIFSNGAKGGLPVYNVAAVPTLVAGELSVSWNSPPAPLGWTLGDAFIWAIEDVDPTASDVITLTGPVVGFSPQVISGLASGALYRVGIVQKWTKPNGSPAYGVGVNASGTPL